MSDLIASLAREKESRKAEFEAIRKKERFFDRGNTLLTEFLKTREKINSSMKKHLLFCLDGLHQNLGVLSYIQEEIDKIKVSLDLEKNRKARHSAARRRKVAKLAGLEKSLGSLNSLLGTVIVTVKKNLEVVIESFTPVKKYQSTMDCYNVWCEEGWENYETEISNFIWDIKAHSKPDIFNVFQEYGVFSSKGTLRFDQDLNDWMDDYQDKFEEIEDKLKAFFS